MLYIVAAVLLTLWLTGLITSYTNPDYPDEKHDYHDFKQGRRFLDYNPFGIIYAKNVDLSDKESMGGFINVLPVIAMIAVRVWITSGRKIALIRTGFPRTDKTTIGRFVNTNSSKKDGVIQRLISTWRITREINLTNYYPIRRRLLDRQQIFFTVQ
jgi:hypothetical protein